MQIQVNSNNSVVAHEGLTREVEATVEAAVRRWRNRITRVEVHLNDLNSHKGGAQDKRCLLEARVGGLQPVAVSHKAATVQEALAGAADKLERALESTFGRLNDR
jgi:ribosome-associated translation inhibitor RaiA